MSCCQLIALNGGVEALLRLMRGCNRSDPHVRLLKLALATLLNLCCHPALLPVVFQAEECVYQLGERMQFFRDAEVWASRMRGASRALTSPHPNLTLRHVSMCLT